ncbi:MAG: glycoside hydrolase family 2 TIM barrel-domain containing protein, partial [Bacteroidota bacterium]
MKTKILLIVMLYLLQCLHTDAQPNTEIKYLSGKGKDDMVQWDFFCSEGRKSGEWTKIGVPSCWELQGFGGYNYGHDAEQDRHREYGLYKYTFEVPKQWQGRSIKIVFEGAMTDTEVKINGQSAGDLHQGAFYEFRYDISDLLNYDGENLLEVKVNKVSANESINIAERKADFWIFGGIYRPVYLQADPADHISRIGVDAKASGDITADLFIHSIKADDVRIHLSDLKGTNSEAIEISKLNKGEDVWSVTARAADIKTWTPEDPHLYQLQIDLLDTDDTVLHTYHQRIGFRTIEIRDGDGIYVNGHQIKFKGVNRHSFHPSSGRTTSKAISIRDVQMMKGMNMNAVRMSHYPPDVHFLDVCDSLGLFVIDEICTWQAPHLDTEVGEKIVKETVIRDVNHPSIVLWANGNEGGWNTELDDDFGQWDIQNREVIHPWAVFGKMNTMHYPRHHVFAYDSYVKDKIYCPTEFLHGLYDGGHGAGLADYWQQMWDLPNGAGGFLWVFADEAVERTDRGGILDSDGNHAPDGIVGPYGEKEGSYYTIKEVWSPIYIAERYIREGFSGVFDIENRYHFTNLSECSITARWLKYDGFSSEKKLLKEEVLSLPDLAPAEKRKFTVDLSHDWSSADILMLTAVDKHGMEIFTWTYPVYTTRKTNAAEIQRAEKGKINFAKDGEKVIVSGSDFKYTFSATTGLLEEVVKSGRQIPLHKGPITLNQESQLQTITFDPSPEQLAITVLYTFPGQENRPVWRRQSPEMIQWTIDAEGVLDLHVEMQMRKNGTGSKGVTFSFPEQEVAGMTWLGEGPYRVWRNRMHGTQFAIWEYE